MPADFVLVGLAVLVLGGVVTMLFTGGIKLRSGRIIGRQRKD